MSEVISKEDHQEGHTIKNLKKDTEKDTGDNNAVEDEKNNIPSDEKLVTSPPVNCIEEKIVAIKDTEPVQEDEKPAKEKSRIMYTFEQMHKINEKEGTERRHESLNDKYFKTNFPESEKERSRWDPEAWHKSEDSRSASPQVEWNDSISLAPKRGSFEQGCHVKKVADVTEKVVVDRSKRLTNRAAIHRTVPESNYKDAESISAKTSEFEALRKGRNNFPSRDRTYSNDRNLPNKPKQVSKYEQQGKYTYNNTPEWMSDAPMVGDDFNFFSSEIEEEKKAFAQQKKRVKISPTVETQIFKKGKKSRTPSPRITTGLNDKEFDLTKFMKDVEYYPPKMFKEDSVGTKSRFTQYFQAKGQEANALNGPIIPDEIISGTSQVSPKVSQQFFAPIQPAPVLLNAAANAHAQQSSNIAGIIEKNRKEKLIENLSKAKQEVSGSLSLEEIEGRGKPSSVINNAIDNQNGALDNRAFNSLLLSMKNAGQLPEKPSPIVTGLPAHLLPQPPPRTSPVFEKLRRSLSRSPSPKDFAKAVSTVASIISAHPSINQELAILKTATVLKASFASDEKSRLSNGTAITPKSQPISTHMHSSTGPSSQPRKQTNAFTPTSVLKKMHKGKKDEGQSSHPDVSNVNFQSNGKYPDILPDQAKKQQKQNNEKVNLNSQFLEAAVTPDRFKLNNDPEVSKLMPFNSAPVTPKNHYPVITEPHFISASAPGTPNNRSETNPPLVKRVTVSSLENKDAVLLAPSAFKTVNGSNSSSRSDLGVIGSGIRQEIIDTTAYNNFVDQIGKLQVREKAASPRQLPANPKLAPGNRSFELRNIENQMHEDSGSRMPHAPRPQSQQQQLLQNQRMAQIQQAQLLQQQKLQEIAKLGKQDNVNDSHKGHSSNISHLLSDPENNDSQAMHYGNRRSPIFQQQQQQQYLNFQQQQQMNLLNHHRAHMNMPPMQGHQSRLPMNQMQHPPPQYPGMHQPRHFNPVNFAAQSLMQQQLINQAARARLLAQAQAQAQLMQQPQVVHAALMAQAALVRGQAQAQAAMMLNPRNIHAMAEHMGLRQPFNPNKQHNGRKSSNSSTPTSLSPEEHDKGNDKSILSKWFSNDVLQQAPQVKGVKDNFPKEKFMSVEELERGRK